MRFTDDTSKISRTRRTFLTLFTAGFSGCIAFDSQENDEQNPDTSNSRPDAQQEPPDREERSESSEKEESKPDEENKEQELSVESGDLWKQYGFDEKNTYNNRFATPPKENIQILAKSPKDFISSQTPPLVLRNGIALGAGEGQVIKNSGPDEGLEREFSTGNLALHPDGLSCENGLIVASPDIYNFRNNKVWAIDSESGDVEWTYKTGFHRPHYAHIKNGTVYLAGHDAVPVNYNGSAHEPVGTTFFAIDAETGEKNWKASVSRIPGTGGIVTGPIIDENTLYYVIRPNINAVLVKVDMDSREAVNWYELPDRINHGTFPPALYQENMYFVSTNGLHAVNINSGEQEWHYNSKSMAPDYSYSLPAPLVVSEEGVFVPGRQNVIFKIGHNGKLKNKKETQGSISGFVGAKDMIYALWTERKQTASLNESEPDANDYQHILKGFKKSNLEEVFSIPINGIPYGNPSVVNNQIIVPCRSHLFAIGEPN